ncbi:unnamed protein product [Blepharisma stoltei]|uniref:Transposase n=1 Tax=Blepharisma stoltei TaxID=1481888 RepID=A0AAU9INQ3_9CILI|nr:unnamed protein product [Blepharisma stoltei]
MNEYLSDQEKTRELALRLKAIKAELKPLYNGKILRAKQVPNRLKEEIVEIYDQYGGRSILMKLFNISYSHIKSWRKQWKDNPNCFKEADNDPSSQSLHFTNSVLEGFKKTTEKSIERFSKSSFKIKEDNEPLTLSNVKELLSPEIQEKCEEIKEMMSRAKRLYNKMLDNEIREEIVKLVIKAGYAKPIALLLGISEKTILGWRDLFVKELDENNQKVEDIEES